MLPKSILDIIEDIKFKYEDCDEEILSIYLITNVKISKEYQSIAYVRKCFINEMGQEVVELFNYKIKQTSYGKSLKIVSTRGEEEYCQLDGWIKRTDYQGRIDLNED